VSSAWSVPMSYLEDIWRYSSVKSVLTEDLCVVQKEEISITCYMCEMYT
jgi:hypothetical protein